MTGGFLLKHFSWSSVFWVNIPIGITALVAGVFLVPTSRDPNQSKLDPIGALLSIIGLGTLLFGIIEGPGKGWTDPRCSAAFVVGIVALAAFIAWERHTDHPMLDMTFFRNPRFTAANSSDHAHVLRPVRLAVPDDAVLAVRARLQPARSRRAPDPLRRSR